MKKLGFNDKWVGLIFQCISIVSFRVLVNGEPSDPFCTEKGLRQGDPFSPYLFLLVQDSLDLSRLLNAGSSSGVYKGLKIKRNCPTLSHLFFADDLIFFAR